MRMILFFDLPVKTKKERHIYSKFRQDLIKRGFMMMQYSVYSKIFANREAAKNETNSLMKVVPEKGNIRIMIVTEKQYSKIICIVGGISNQERKITRDSLIII